MPDKRLRLKIFAVVALSILLKTQVANADTAGTAVPGSIDYPRGGMRRIGKVKLSTPNVFRSLYGGMIDKVHGYAYFSPAAMVNPGWVIKVNITGPLPVEVGAAQCGTGDINLLSGVVDSATGYGYFGSLGSPGRVVKVRLEYGDVAPTYLGSTPLNAGPVPPAENNVFGMVADFANGHIFAERTPRRATSSRLIPAYSTPCRHASMRFNWIQVKTTFAERLSTPSMATPTLQKSHRQLRSSSKSRLARATVLRCASAELMLPPSGG